MDINGILAIAARDFTKLIRDRARIIGALTSPVLTVVVLGGGGQATFEADFNILHYVLVGVMVQSCFTSTASGMVWLLEDRQNDFSQAIFVSPISRYSIVFGKILGETLVALPQGIVLIIMGVLVGLPLSMWQAAALLGVLVAACLTGGALGLLAVTNASSQRSANQIVPWLVFPQVFFASVYFPLDALPFPLENASRLMPLRYPVDLARAVAFAGQPDEIALVVQDAPLSNLLVMAAIFAVLLVVGTALFVRSERNR